MYVTLGARHRPVFGSGHVSPLEDRVEPGLVIAVNTMIMVAGAFFSLAPI